VRDAREPERVERLIPSVLTVPESVLRLLFVVVRFPESEAIFPVAVARLLVIFVTLVLVVEILVV